MRHWRAGCDRKTHAQFGKGPKEKGQKWYLVGGLLHFTSGSVGGERKRVVFGSFFQQSTAPLPYPVSSVYAAARTATSFSPIWGWAVHASIVMNHCC